MKRPLGRLRYPLVGFATTHGFGQSKCMAAFLSRVRERGPRLWGVRLLLGVALLGLLLTGVWQGEIHSHDSGGAAHSHGQGHDAPGTDPHPDRSAPEPLHLHDATVTVVMLGPPRHGTDLPKLSANWAPDAPALHAPPPLFNAPHRPPIA